MTEEWHLPVALDNIRLDRNELLLLDWLLCGASRLLPDCELGYLVPTWHETRMAVWAALGVIDHQGDTPTVQPFRMDDATARVILAIGPTTFRWGTGVDCGYSLKTKIARFLRGERDEDEPANNPVASQDKTPDDPYD